MPEGFKEVTHASWLGRIGGALKGILVGLVLFLVAFPLLFWNEGRAVRRHQTLEEGGGAVVSVPADRVDAGNEGKLVHLTGTAVTDATLSDAAFGVSARGVRLKRTVEMYQWQERAKSTTSKQVGGGTETTTTYTYTKTWSATLLSSADFKKPQGHRNPEAMPYDSVEYTAEHVRLGAFTLSPSLVRKIDNFTSLPVPGDAPLPEALRGKGTVHDGGFYLGGDPTSPQVGDVRVRFAVVRPGEVSLIARQARDTFEPYATQAGGTIELLQPGVHTAEAMIRHEQESNVILTWVLRLAGFLLMLFGLALVFRPLSVVADVLPILGSLVGVGTGLIAFLVAFSLSLATVAIAWIAYRPLLGAALLVAAAGLALGIGRRLARRPG